MINHDLIKPNDLWYVIGLIVTDGNLSSDRRHINITSKDKDLLDSVKSALHITNKLTLKGNGNNKNKIYYFLQFGDVVFYKFLLNIGLTPNKSLTMGIIDVPSLYFNDFLRGVIDGDGSIQSWMHRTNKHIQWSLRICSGAYVFANWIKTEIEKQYFVRGKLHGYFNPNKNPIYTVKFGKLSAKVIIKEIYYPNCLALNRKMILAMSCLESKIGHAKYGNVI